MPQLKFSSIFLSHETIRDVNDSRSSDLSMYRKYRLAKNIVIHPTIYLSSKLSEKYRKFLFKEEEEFN